MRWFRKKKNYFDAFFHFVSSASKRVFERVKRDHSPRWIFIHPRRSSCGTSYLPDFRTHCFICFSRVLSDLSLLSRHYSLSRNRLVATSVFHCADQSHDPRRRDCSVNRDYFLPGSAPGFRSASKDRPHHLAVVVLRVHHWRNRLPYALSNLSLLSYDCLNA